MAMTRHRETSLKEGLFFVRKDRLWCRLPQSVNEARQVVSPSSPPSLASTSHQWATLYNTLNQLCVCLLNHTGLFFLACNLALKTAVCSFQRRFFLGRARRNRDGLMESRLRRRRGRPPGWGGEPRGSGITLSRDGDHVITWWWGACWNEEAGVALARQVFLLLSGGFWWRLHPVRWNLVDQQKLLHVHLWKYSCL